MIFPGKAHTNHAGFTLIEIIMTILILGMVSLILIPYFGSIRSSASPVLRQRAVSLAQSMMDEILAKRWDENTPIGGGAIVTTESPWASRVGPMTNIAATLPLGLEAPELAGNRSNWDDVDDFNGHTETNTFLDQNNNGFTLTGYTRTVQIDYISSSASDPIDATTAISGAATDTKRIMVTVTSPNNETFRLIAVACNI